MTDAAPDRAKFVIFPPVIPYSTLAIACILQWLEPLGLVAHIERDLRIWLGLLVVVVGMAIMFAGHRALLRHGTNINPLRPTTALVTDGVFRRTRNPLFCNGPRSVNPFLRCPLAGDGLLSGLGARPSLHGFRGG